jgi:hypothetical protein
MELGWMILGALIYVMLSNLFRDLSPRKPHQEQWTCKRCQRNVNRTVFR